MSDLPHFMAFLSQIKMLSEDPPKSLISKADKKNMQGFVIQVNNLSNYINRVTEEIFQVKVDRTWPLMKFPISC